MVVVSCTSYYLCSHKQAVKHDSTGADSLTSQAPKNVQTVLALFVKHSHVTCQLPVSLLTSTQTKLYTVHTLPSTVCENVQYTCTQNEKVAILLNLY